MNYSTLIKALRESMILSQEEFANYLGVSFATVNRWEKGHHEPTYTALSFLWKSKAYPIGIGQKIAYLFTAQGKNM